jgi:hypothetical protein
MRLEIAYHWRSKTRLLDDVVERGKLSPEWGV